MGAKLQVNITKNHVYGFIILVTLFIIFALSLSLNTRSLYLLLFAVGLLGLSAYIVRMFRKDLLLGV